MGSLMKEGSHWLEKPSSIGSGMRVVLSNGTLVKSSIRLQELMNGTMCGIKAKMMC